MAVTTLDGLVAALTAGETRAYMKSAFTASAVGATHSLWTVAGTPGAGAAEGTVNGSIPTDATAGSFPFVNAAGAANNYLGYIAAASQTAGTLILYDRLWHDSALSATATTDQAISPPALTRFTSGEGVELWAEQYAAFGTAGALTITVTYTDQGGTASQIGTIAKAAVAGVNGTMYQASLASGDYGVRAVTAYRWSSTATSGNWGLTLLKRLVTIPLQTLNVAAVYDAFSSGLREVPDDACLAFMVQCSATAMGIIGGELTVAKG
jgi:hypothetical protein